MGQVPQREVGLCKGRVPVPDVAVKILYVESYIIYEEIAANAW